MTTHHRWLTDVSDRYLGEQTHRQATRNLATGVLRDGARDSLEPNNITMPGDEFPASEFPASESLRPDVHQGRYPVA